MSYYGRNRETILARSQAKRDAKRLAGVAGRVAEILVEPVPLLLGLSSHISGRHIISKEDALYWGEKRYFTGVPCARGHLAQRTVSGSHCLECRKVTDHRYRGSKPLTEATKHRRWCRANPEDLEVKRRVEARRYRLEKGRPNKKYSELTDEQKSAVISRKKEWYRRCPGNKARSKYTTMRWRKNNPGLKAYYDSVRRCRKANATPDWLTDDQIKEIKVFYDKAKRFTELTGVKHVVDHIYPIKGRGYRGLHVPWNLQVITSTENSEKNNKDPSEWSRTF